MFKNCVITEGRYVPLVYILFYSIQSGKQIGSQQRNCK